MRLTASETWLRLAGRSELGYWYGWSIVVAAYFTLSAWLLIAGDFIPYVLDNNESFSSLIHAYNLFHFSLADSKGLADEAASPFAAAHPVVHTHQGNWPRLYAFVLFSLGARSIEAQIIVTTYTVGLGSIMLAYHFFSRILSSGYALAACILLLTDYLLFGHWQLVTYRVWHTAFFFAAFVCVQQAAAMRPSHGWYVAIFLINLCLAYYEIAFAGFVMVATGLFAAVLLWRRSKRLALVWASQVTGALVGVGIVLAQLVGYLGWEGFLQDLRLTFTVRNFGAESARIAELRAFLETHNIATFFNFVDSRPLLRLDAFFQSFFRWGYQIYTPVLATSLLLPAVAGLLALWRFTSPESLSAVNQPSNRGVEPAQVVLFGVGFGLVILAPLSSILACVLLLLLAGVAALLRWRYSRSVNASGEARITNLIILALAFFMFLRTLWLGPSAWLNATVRSDSLVLLMLAHLALGAVSVVAAVYGRRMARGQSCISGAWFLLAAAAYLWAIPSLFDLGYAPLWHEALLPGLPVAAWKTVVMVSAFVATEWLLSAERPVVFKTGNVGTFVFLLLCCFVSFALVYRLLPGYMHSGYLWRFTPFHVFFLAPLAAFGLYMLVVSAGVLARRAWIYCHHMGLRRFWANAVAGAAVAVLTAVLTASWFSLQIGYVDRLPPDSFAFAKQMREPPLRGASVVSNAYALPFSNLAGSWAYLDAHIGQGEYRLDDNGYSLIRDDRALWFADRTENPAYGQPAYFVCFFANSLHTVLARHEERHGSYSNNCNNVGLVRQAKGLAAETLMNHRLVAEDLSQRAAWAIVELDWDFPPFLSPFDETSRTYPVGLSIGHVDDTPVATVTYGYRQQQGQAEGETLVSLHQAALTSGGCYQVGRLLQKMTVSGGAAQLKLPRETQVQPVVATVTPRSLSRSGQTMTSRVVDPFLGILPRMPCGDDLPLSVIGSSKKG